MTAGKDRPNQSRKGLYWSVIWQWSSVGDCQGLNDLCGWFESSHCSLDVGTNHTANTATQQGEP